MTIATDKEWSRRSFWGFAKRAWPHVGEPGAFTPNWHLEAICEECEGFALGEYRLSVVNVPPSMAKSMITSVLFPAWVWTAAPETRFMFASYSVDLGIRDAQRLERLLRSDWYCDRWGAVLAPGPVAYAKLKTRANGYRFATSMAASATGFHADFIMLDDPIKPLEVDGKICERTNTAIDQTFSSRAQDPRNFRLMITMQRLGEIDPAAHLLSKGAHHLRLPNEYEPDDADPRDRRTTAGELLFPARLDREETEIKKRDDPLTYATQYQQSPGAKGGAIWPDDFGVISQADWDSMRGQCAQSWDLAFKGNEVNDWIAGQWWKQFFPRNGETEFFLGPDPIFKNLDFVQTLATIQGQRKLWPSTEILIEDKANGPAIESVLQKQGWHEIRMVEPSGSKVGRAHSVAPLFRSKRVRVVDGPWVPELRRIWGRFPRVRRDDPVDAASQALIHMSTTAEFHALMEQARRNGL